MRQLNMFKALLFCSKDARAKDNETLESGINLLFMMLLRDIMEVFLYGKEDGWKEEPHRA